MRELLGRLLRGARCPPTTCTDGRRSCSCRARSWSADLAGASAPVLVGPTGIGKTAVACALAAHWDDGNRLGRFAADLPPPRHRHRQADSTEWLSRIPHHGIDLVDPGERYSAGRFARDATRWIEGIRAREHLPVVVGGTGLYIRALADGLFAEPPLDPAQRRDTRRVDRRSRRRRTGPLGVAPRSGIRRRGPSARHARRSRWRS